MKTKLELLTVVILLLTILVIFRDKIPGPSSLLQSNQATQSGKQIPQRMPAEFKERTEVFDISETDAISRQVLYSATLHFCVAKYEPNSCIHYLIVCGQPCKNLVNPQRFAKVRSHYWALMKQRKLKPR